MANGGIGARAIRVHVLDRTQRSVRPAGRTIQRRKERSGSVSIRWINRIPVIMAVYGVGGIIG